MTYLDATADLLKVAAVALKAEVLPHVEADGRYPGAMIAHALAIAARELELGAAARSEERALLAGFFDEPADSGASLLVLRRRLCAELRRGSGPTAARAQALEDLLHRFVVARLAISNPAYAASLERGQP